MQYFELGDTMIITISDTVEILKKTYNLLFTFEYNICLNNKTYKWSLHMSWELLLQNIKDCTLKSIKRFE